MNPPAPRLRQLRRIGEIDAGRWNDLFASAYPFIQHEFLDALERHACVGAATGWQPSHLVLEDDAGRLLGAAPLYVKAHSYGEFVFDWRWAEAAYRSGSAYYPKLVCAIPFTPASGPRLGAADPAHRPILAGALAALPEEAGLSSLHVLFATEDDLPALCGAGALERYDLQFHWCNEGYASFDDFLARLGHDKRKKILRERRRIAESGLRFEVLPGDALDEGDWQEVYRLYANTYEERGQRPYLTRGFFLDYGRRADTPVRVILALDGCRRVAAAITIAGGDTLYGRHWGCAVQYHSLHFETCYYQGIELCIREGFMRFDAGAQGEHKHARGFEPVLTRSLHVLKDPRLRNAVEQHLVRERAAVQSYRDALVARSPYRQTEARHG